MYRHVLTLVLALLLHSVPAYALEIEGVEIAETVPSGDSKAPLLLNGAGLREKLYIDVYVGALYLPVKTTDAAAILSNEGPGSVLMHILYKEISKQKITAGWIDGLDANLSSSELQALKPRLDAFNKLFTATKKGDVLSIAYTPEKGTEVRINGEWRGAV
ncbi:MAG: chalcone isomerase family protein, partial [Gammaproteobacteria bacterium]